MSEPGPHWYIARQEDADWNEADAERFDGAAPYEVVDASHLVALGRTLHLPDGVPEQRIVNRAAQDGLIADAARRASTNIETVIGLWPYPHFDLDELIELHRVLKESQQGKELRSLWQEIIEEPYG